MGAFLSLSGTASINDVFFVHERGFRVGLWNAAVIVSINVAPIISSRIIVNRGWRWAFWVLAISFGVLVGAVVVGMPESSFERNVIEGEAVVPDEEGHTPSFTQLDTTEKGLREDPVISQSPLPPFRESGLSTMPTTFSSMLHPCPASQGSFKDASLSMVGSLRLLGHPATIWACMVWSVMFSWVIILGVVASQIFAAPPYNMTPTAVGNLIGIPPLIGSLLGTLVGGYFCDFVALWLSHRNRGVYEPEFRLWTIFITCIVPLAVGAFGLGAAISDGMSAIVCGFFLASLNFAIGTGCTTIVAYSNDVFGDQAGEVFGLAMMVKSAFAFGLTFMLNDYYASHGPKVFFFTWGSLSLGLTLFGTIPMYVYGKRARAWTR
jgi:MFS family permease